MHRHVKNQQGITLIELLLSIVILSIISLSMYTFFIQAANFSSHNNDRLVAINIARGVAERINTYQDIQSPGSHTLSSCLSVSTSSECTNRYLVLINNIYYEITVTVSSTPLQKTIDFSSYTGGNVHHNQSIGSPITIEVRKQGSTRLLAELGSVIRRWKKWCTI